MRQPNQYAVLLAKSYERKKLQSYNDGTGVLTIGYGHISDAKLKVIPGLTIIDTQAEELFLFDMNEAADLLCKELVYENDLSDNQYSALVDLAFNSGSLKIKHGGKWIPSDLMNALNERNFQIAGELIKHHDIYGGGKIMKGLQRRRLAEYFLFTGYRVGELEPIDWTRWIRTEVDRLIA